MAFQEIGYCWVKLRRFVFCFSNSDGNLHQNHSNTVLQVCLFCLKKAGLVPAFFIFFP